MCRLLHKKYLLHSLLLLVLMNVVFFMTKGVISSAGIGLFIRKSIVCAIAVYIMQHVVKRPFFHRTWLPALAFGAWWYFFLIFKFLVIDAGHASLYEDEIFIGTYGAAALIGLQYFCECCGGNRAMVFAVNLLQWLFSMPPVITYVHYMVYGHAIIFDEMRAVCQTNFREAAEWFMVYVGLYNLILLVAVLIASFALLVYCRKLSMTGWQGYEKSGNKFLILLAALAAVYYPCVLIGRTDSLGYYKLALEHELEAKNYTRDISKESDRIELKNPAAVGASPHTIIMVIGESAGRDYMRAYNEQFPYDNTPWLNQCKNDSNFIVFTNAYACYSLTQPVLENTLTEKSYYNGKTFLQSMNIVDIAKKKGYTTYWITNLGGVNAASSFSLVASRADVVMNYASNYDDSMLDYLKQVDPGKNNFIILHGNGSHARYASRYPEDRAVFKDREVKAEYANAIRYVDDFLKSVYEYGKSELNMQVMLYYSDHGENLKTGHGPSDRSFDKVRIPAFVYLGPEYQSRNPGKFKTLMSRKDSFFTNDMMYNTLSGIMNAESNYYDPAEDLSGEKYKFTLDDLWTFARAVKVKDDPFLKNPNE